MSLLSHRSDTRTPSQQPPQQTRKETLSIKREDIPRIKRVGTRRTKREQTFVAKCGWISSAVTSVGNNQPSFRRTCQTERIHQFPSTCEFQVMLAGLFSNRRNSFVLPDGNYHAGGDKPKQKELEKLEIDAWPSSNNFRAWRMILRSEVTRGSSRLDLDTCH